MSSTSAFPILWVRYDINSRLAITEVEVIDPLTNFSGEFREGRESIERGWFVLLTLVTSNIVIIPCPLQALLPTCDLDHFTAA